MVQREYLAHFGERLGFLPRLFTRTNSGSIWLHAVSVGEVASAMPQPELHLRADRAARYEFVAQLMSAAQRAGLQRIGFVTDPNASTRARGGPSPNTACVAFA